MPRYYFDIHDDNLTVDEVGISLEDDEAAVRQAFLTLPELANNRVKADIRDSNMFIVVRNQDDKTVYISFLSYGGKFMIGE